jgi:hypothetical protein
MDKQYFSRLAPALACAGSRGGIRRVWAMDVARQLYARDMTLRKYTGKRFIVCSPQTIHTLMSKIKQPSYYEVINTDGEIRMYFDIEHSINDESLTPKRASAITTLFYRMLIRLAILIIYLRVHL